MATSYSETYLLGSLDVGTCSSRSAFPASYSSLRRCCYFADNLNLTVGYDAGLQNVVVSAAGDTDVSGKTVAAKATWFSVGSHVRAEASAKLDSRNTIWGR